MDSMDNKTNINSFMEVNIGAFFKNKENDVIFELITCEDSFNDKNEKIKIAKYEYKDIPAIHYITVQYKEEKIHGIVHFETHINKEKITNQLNNYVDGVLHGASFQQITIYKYVEIPVVQLRKINFYRTQCKSMHDKKYKNYVRGKVHGDVLWYMGNKLYNIEHYNYGNIIQSSYFLSDKRIEYYKNNNVNKMIELDACTEYTITSGFSNNGSLHGDCKIYDTNNKLVTHLIYYNGTLMEFKKMIDFKGRDQVIDKTGIIYGYKACTTINDGDGSGTSLKTSQSYGGKNVYVKLRIDENIKRINVHPDGRSRNKYGTNYASRGLFMSDSQYIYKCRSPSAYVEDIYDKDGNKYDKCYSFVHNENVGFEYKKNEYVYSDGYDDNILQSCGQGINYHKFEEDCDQWFN